MKRGEQVVDTVRSYFGLRKIEVAKDEQGVNRIKLNGEFVFQVGPLDQGFWPDGLYTAPTDEALKYDVEITKKLGFNMTRKHVKVEPDRWYYWCDKLGLLVWQDMVAGDKGIGPNDPDLKRSPESARQFEVELKAMIDGLREPPEHHHVGRLQRGLGPVRHGPDRRLDEAVRPDPAGRLRQRLDRPPRRRRRPRPALLPAPGRPAAGGEAGGRARRVRRPGARASTATPGRARPGATRGRPSRDDLTRKYEGLLREAWDLKDAKGLNAVVYTQITDVETEANGLLTYDREVIKVDPDRVAAVEPRRLLEGARRPRDRPHLARRRAGLAVHDRDAPGRLERRRLRRLGLEDRPRRPRHREHPRRGRPHDVGHARRLGAADGHACRAVDPANVHDDGPPRRRGRVYLNGVLAASLKGYLGNYEEIPIPAEARATLKPGKAVIAVHCHQNAGGQSIDAGLVEVVPAGR